MRPVRDSHDQGKGAVKSLVRVLAIMAALAVPPAVSIAATPSEDDHDIADLPLNRFGVGFFFQDVVTLTPGTGGFIGRVDGAVMGVAGTVQRRLSSGSSWFLDAGAGYGSGEETVHVLQPLAFTDRASFRALYGRAGMGYEVRLTREASAYASGGVFYSSARARFDNGGIAVDGARFIAWGLDQALGARVTLGGEAGLYGEHVASYGWGSGRGPDARYRASVKNGGFRGGLMFGF
jgi:hypothetical protein